MTRLIRVPDSLFSLSTVIPVACIITIEERSKVRYLFDPPSSSQLSLLTFHSVEMLLITLFHPTHPGH